MTPVRWGLLSTARIGATMLAAARGSAVTSFVAVASRDGARAERFARRHGIPRWFGCYEEMLAGDDVDAVYVALPVSLHTEWTVKALEAGKHVLCEKPFAVSAADAERAFGAAERSGCLVAEALMWRHHPQTALARRLVAEGAIGDLELVRAALTVSVPDGDIRRTRSLGGGALLDLGCYCASGIRLFGGEAGRVYAEAVLDDDGVDLRMAGTVRLSGDVLGQLDIGLTHERRDELVLVGTLGQLTVPDPWIGVSRGLVLRRDGVVNDVPFDAPDGSRLGQEPGAVYRHEIDLVSRAIRLAEPLPFGRDDAVAQAGLLEALMRSARDGVPVEPASDGNAASVREVR